MSGKSVILTAIYYRGVEYVLDNIERLADDALLTERYARSVVRDVINGRIVIKQEQSNDHNR